MITSRIVHSAIAWTPLLAIITVQLILSDAFPWQGRRSISVPISYRLDAWSQYDNPEEGTDREGDIHENEQSRKTTTRNPHLLWLNGIVHYYVDSSIVNEPAKHAVLDDAIATIEENTCIKFVRIFPKNGKFPGSSWVNITGQQRGCFSDLGRSRSGPSVLNLDIKRCFRTRGHALHELLHTLGVYHEHMRPDRDDFIKILWDNIREGDAFNFRVLDTKTVTNYDLPYDYDSIMHYSMTAFSKDKGTPTIVPIKDDVDIGQRNHLSGPDIQKLLITYKCENLNEVMAYQEVDQHTHSDRLEILNLNASAALPQADSFVDDYNVDSAPLEIRRNGERAMNSQRPDSSCPCSNPFFYYYYYYRKEKPRCSNRRYNYYHLLQQ